MTGPDGAGRAPRPAGPMGGASLQVRSTVVATGVVAVALLVGMAVAYWMLLLSLRTAAITAAQARCTLVAQLIAEEGRASLDSDRRPVPGELVQLIDARGQIVDGTPSTALGVHLAYQPPATASVNGVGSASTVTEVAPLPRSGSRQPVMVVARTTLDGPGGAPLTVVVGRSVAALGETLGSFGRLAVFAVPVLVGSAGLATWILVGRTLAPVAGIRRRVQEITAGRLDERVPVPAVRDEIGLLAETMNSMLAGLEGAQKSQRRFVADAGHELRSPLATIAVAVAVTRRRLAGMSQNEVQHVLDDIEAENARMSRLVEDLLLLARADEQGLRLRHEEVDLDELVLAEARRLRTVCAAAVEVSCSAVRVTGDPDRLAQVLRNLTDNAARYARGRIRLTLGESADRSMGGRVAVLRVEDDGPGIPKAARAEVFDRFVRLDASRERGTGGSGLGLAIVREIVQGHGGRVSVGASRWRGAMVTVRLPRADD